MPTDNPLIRENFERCLDKILDDATNSGQSSIVIQAGKLHRIVGRYQVTNNRIPMCCSVMRSRMQESDETLPNSLKKDGASLQICYLLKNSFHIPIKILKWLNLIISF